MKNVAGMKLSRNKWEAVQATAPRDRWAALMLGLPLYHQRYGEVTAEDFDYFPWSEGLINYKGSFALYGHGNFDLGDAAAIALEEATIHGQEYISVEELQQASGVASSVFDKLRAVGALGSLPETSQVDLFSLM